MYPITVWKLKPSGVAAVKRTLQFKEEGSHRKVIHFAENCALGNVAVDACLAVCTSPTKIFQMLVVSKITLIPKEKNPVFIYLF